jgi:hypothetical protein
MQVATDVITWRIVVSVLAFVCVSMATLLYKLVSDRFTRMEDKLDGIIRYLVAHSDDGEQEELGKLIGR